MFRFRHLSCVLIVSSWCCPGVEAQNGPNFNGRWVLNQAASDVSHLPQAPDNLVLIDQEGSVIQWATVPGAGDKPPELLTFPTDGTESRREMGGVIVNSKTKWEGDALLTSTIVSTPADDYTVMDRWQLSRDGRRLTIERDVTGKSGEKEGTLVYERERRPGDPPPQADAPRAASRPPVPEPAPSAPQVASDDYVVKEGTHLPLRLINSVSTKYSAEGDRVYLETMYPILSHGRVVIPAHSYVTGSLTEVKRAGRIKGKSQMFLRFDSLTLPNGTTRDFRARLSQSDATAKGKLDSEGAIQGEGGKGSDTKTVIGATAAGTTVGAIAGGAAGHLGMGAGIGAAAGAVGGLAGILATRGPDAVLERGSTVEMVLDRDLTFTAQEIPR
jgi:hypothetical protein